MARINRKAETKKFLLFYKSWRLLPFARNDNRIDMLLRKHFTSADPEYIIVQQRILPALYTCFAKSSNESTFPVGDRYRRSLVLIEFLQLGENLPMRAERDSFWQIIERKKSQLGCIVSGPSFAAYNFASKNNEYHMHPWIIEARVDAKTAIDCNVQVGLLFGLAQRCFLGHFVVFHKTGRQRPFFFPRFIFSSYQKNFFILN